MADDGDDDFTLPTDGGPVEVPRQLAQRFDLIEPVARGGSGVVYRAFDRELRCRAAVKVIETARHTPAEALFDRPPADHLFRHPCLVRVFSRGRWAGGVWVAMEWVDGAPLSAWIDAAHALTPSDEFTLRPADATDPPPEAAPAVEATEPLTLVRVLYEAALGIGAAHGQGLVHLDLKPDNIMVEVRAGRPVARTPGVWHDEDADRRWTPRLIDWGLSRSVEDGPDGEGAPNGSGAAGQAVPVHGVPAYLAPERAAGRRDGVRPQADVYALGAILYRILTGDRPFGARPRAEVVACLARGERPDPPDGRADPDLIEFCAVCSRAMAVDPAERYPDGAAFALALRRAQAVRLLRLAAPLRHRAEGLRGEAGRLQDEASRRLRAEEDLGPAEQHAAWDLEGRAADREAEANLREAQWVQKLRDVLALDPGMPEGRAALIEWQCAQLLDAESRGDDRLARLSLEALRTDLRRFDERTIDAVEPAIRRTVRRARWLVAGSARLSLRTHPEALIEVASQREVHRRLTTGPFKALGRGALDGVEAPFGRLVLRLSAPGHHPVLYPLRTHRGQAWTTARPGEESPHVIPLPPLDALGADEAYVPPGWCWVGGERHACDALWPGRWIWVDGFVMRTEPVTHRQWIAFLDDLVAAGRGDEAAVRVPGGALTPSSRPPSLPGYVRVDGRHRLVPSSGRDGNPPSDVSAALGWPVGAITRDDALAYVRWRAARDGRPWRLPSEWEFEKAARCGDQRRLPWGSHLEPRWTRIGRSTAGQYQPAPVASQTQDVSVHGIRWLVGNMLTWCLEGWSDPAPTPGGVLDLARAVAGAAGGGLRMVRGGSFSTPEQLVSGATRFALAAVSRSVGTGLRLVRSWPGSGDG